MAIIEDRAFIPNLVGEISYGLDSIFRAIRRGVRHHRVTFSLPLLQCWFYTHLGITAYDLRGGPGLLSTIVARSRLPAQTYRDTTAYFRGLREDDFYPRAPTFVDTIVISGSSHGPYIPIMGVSGSSYYVPARVLHQLGGPSWRPLPPRRLLPSIDMDDPAFRRPASYRAVHHLTRIWGSLQTATFAPVAEDREERRATARRFEAQRLALRAD